MISNHVICAFGSDPVIVSLIPAQPHTSVETDFQLPYKLKYVHRVLVLNPLSLSLPRKSVIRIIGRLNMTIANDWDATNKQIISKSTKCK